ncbi:MAG: DUF6751 family protein [Oscillospiraceae bacterium]
MKYNGECTVWHKTNDGYTTLHYPCWWQDTETVNITKSGKIDVDSVLVHIPVNADVSKSDYIVKGNIDFNLTGSATELLKNHKPLKITTVSIKDYGSKVMQHTEVTAK